MAWCAVVAMACSGGSTAGGGPAGQASALAPAVDAAPAEPAVNPNLAVVAAMQRKMEEACACRDAQCLDAVDGRYAETLSDEARAAAAADPATGARVAAIEGEEQPCRERALAGDGSPATAGDSAITARFERARDAVCQCRRLDCLERAERGLSAMAKGLTDEQLNGLERADFDRLIVLGDEARRCGARIRAGQ